MASWRRDARVAARADAILARLHDAEEDLDDLLGLRAGKLRMSTLSSTAATIVPEAILEFRDRLPDVELSVSILEPPGVMPLLRSGDVDLALCNDASVLELPESDGALLLEEPMLVALPARHRLAGRRRLRLRELALTKRIPFVWLLDSAGARVQEAAGAMFAGSGHLFREEVVASGGVEWLEPPVVEDEELDAAERPLDSGVAAVAAGECEVSKQLGDALVEDGAIIAADLVAEG